MLTPVTILKNGTLTGGSFYPTPPFLIQKTSTRIKRIINLQKFDRVILDHFI
jgi:hypothetical protein